MNLGEIRCCTPEDLVLLLEKPVAAYQLPNLRILAHLAVQRMEGGEIAVVGFSLIAREQHQLHRMVSSVAR